MHLATYVGLLETGSETLAASYRQVAEGHAAEADVHHLCLQLSAQCDEHRRKVGKIAERYGDHPDGEPERLHAEGLSETRSGGLGLLRDLHDLYLLATYLDVAWMMVGQAAKGVRDHELNSLVDACAADIEGQLAWLTTRMKSASVQALVAAD